MMEKYELAGGGWVRFRLEDVQSVRPHYDDTAVTLTNGQTYILRGDQSRRIRL